MKKKKDVFGLFSQLIHAIALQNLKEYLIVGHIHDMNKHFTLNHCVKKAVFKCDCGGRKKLKYVDGVTF